MLRTATEPEVFYPEKGTSTEHEVIDSAQALSTPEPEPPPTHTYGSAVFDGLQSLELKQ
ncbi:MAG: hypothetical protein M1812_008295, partial [Candelaria pacifica]